MEGRPDPAAGAVLPSTGPAPGGEKLLKRVSRLEREASR